VLLAHPSGALLQTIVGKQTANRIGNFLNTGQATRVAGMQAVCD
jgi:hypothetical protein